MIRVTVELISARTGEKSHLGTMLIANYGTASDGSGDASVGNYDATLLGKAHQRWRRARVTDFPRKRLLVWDLMFRVLKNVVGKRNFT